MACTVVVTLGRNIADQPMPIGTWNSYKQDVAIALERAYCTLVQQPLRGEGFADQLGTWDGQTEPACAFVALYKGAHSDDYVWSVLHDRLKPLLLLYQQDAIGLIVLPRTDHYVTRG